jgi:hypothetical protein
MAGTLGRGFAPDGAQGLRKRDCRAAYACRANVADADATAVSGPATRIRFIPLPPSFDAPVRRDAGPHKAAFVFSGIFFPIHRVRDEPGPDASPAVLPPASWRNRDGGAHLSVSLVDSPDPRS